MIDPQRLGRALAAARGRAGLSQRDLAQRLGLTVNYLSLIEHGHRGVALTTIERLAELAGLRPSEIIAAAEVGGAAAAWSPTPARRIRQKARPAELPPEARVTAPPAMQRRRDQPYGTWIPGF
ncbi:MAG: helix-turn-helix transcriptional regulator [Phycisphaerae bacterium]